MSSSCICSLHSPLCGHYLTALIQTLSYKLYKLCTVYVTVTLVEVTAVNRNNCLSVQEEDCQDIANDSLSGDMFRIKLAIQ